MSFAREEAVYSVACLGLEWSAEVSLKSLLGLLKDRTTVTWRHSDDLNADVIVYNPASPLAHALMRREGEHPHRHVFVPCSANDPGAAGLALPLGSGQLIRCLEGALAQLGERHIQHGAERPHLCQRLDEMLQSTQAVGVMLSVGGQRGVIDRAQRMIHWPSRLGADDVAQLLFEDVELEPLGADQVQILHTVKRWATEAIPWDAALWALGIGTSGGRLLARLGAARRYRLTRWPDFGMIGRRSNDLKCSALLARDGMSPLALQASTGFPLGTIHNFFNACALCGLLEEPGQAIAATRAATPAGGASVAAGMLARIRKAFALGTA